MMMIMMMIGAEMMMMMTRPSKARGPFSILAIRIGKESII